MEKCEDCKNFKADPMSRTGFVCVVLCDYQEAPIEVKEEDGCTMRFSVKDDASH